MSLEKLGATIVEVAEATGESAWTVKNKLRTGVYQGKKSGRRTIVVIDSVRRAWENLPPAKFAPPRATK